MKVALYYPWIYLKGGAERALCELVTRSRHDWTLYTNHYDRHATFPAFSDLNVVQCGPDISVKRNLSSVAAAAMTVAFQRIDTAGHDRAVMLSEGLGNLVARRVRVPTTCVCLTPLKVAYDDVTNARFFRGGARRSYRTAFRAYRAVDRFTWKHYDKVFCISETVRARILQYNLVAEDRIEVVYPGVDHEWFQPAGNADSYFLIPGRIMWQKNIEVALEAWRFFKPHPADNDFRLVIAGMVDDKSRDYLATLRAKVAWRDDVDFLSSPDDAQLRSLYQRAYAVLFTAPSEDFGLVPLEAMACGKIVIAPSRGGPTETVIDGETGLLTVDEPRAFAAAIASVVAMDASRRALMESDARSRALEFDWKHFVGRIDDHLDEPSKRRVRSRGIGRA